MMEDPAAGAAPVEALGKGNVPESGAGAATAAKTVAAAASSPTAAAAVNSSISTKTAAAASEPEYEAAEDLDPRIQVELEKLNCSTDVINKLELDLEEARSTFRHLLDESGRNLGRLQKEIGPSVEKARPYYDARMKARLALAEAQHAAARFEKASGAHEAAKEMVTLAEEGFKERGVVHFDQAWQEMLNHATTRVNESEVERNLSEEEHRVKSKAYQAAEKKVIALQRSLKRSINKSRPYFEVKARLNQSLDDQKRQIQVIEETIQMTKAGYSDSLKELERISEEIHERRKKRAAAAAAKDQESSSSLAADAPDGVPPDGVRGTGVGAEFPSPSPIERKLNLTLERQKSSSGFVSGTSSTAARATSTPASGGDKRRESVSSSSTESHDSEEEGCDSDSTNVPTNVDGGDAGKRSTPEATVVSVDDISFELTPPPHSHKTKEESVIIPKPKLPSQTADPTADSTAVPRRKIRNKHLSVKKLKEDDDCSDCDSIASMEMMDDSKIEFLMKDASLQQVADEMAAVSMVSDEQGVTMTSPPLEVSQRKVQSSH